MTKPIDFLIDIETLGTKPGATILEIAASCGADGLTLLIDPDSHPGKFELNTLLWWSTVPDKKAKERAFGSSSGRIGLKDAIGRLNEFIEKVKPDYFWGCSPDFDYKHLEYWYKYFQIEIPWKFYQFRDVRTIRDVLTQEKIDELERQAGFIGECKHIANYDVDLEARIVRTFRQKIELLK